MNDSKIKTVISIVAVAFFGFGCTSDDASQNDTIGALGAAEAVVDDMNFSGVNLTLDGIQIANLSQLTPVVSVYGSVARGTTLNLLNKNGTEFLVYREDGVFAAECEPSVLDASYGSSHPLCKTLHAESFDTLIVCFANSTGSSLMTAQSWPGAAQAFNPGLGMICYQDGTRLQSTHFFTY